MKIVHLILAHEAPGQILRLINSLQHNEADFFIHIDQKTAIEPFLSLIRFNNVYFVKNRAKVYWGTYSVVRATLYSLEEILSFSKNYSHINLLSGSDYPLRPTQEIHDYFNENSDTAFIHYKDIEKEWPNVIYRTKKYYFGDYLKIGSVTFGILINKLFPLRKVVNDFILVGHSQWLTITPKHAEYILKYINENPEVKRFYRLSLVPDESMFHTILFNSPLKETIVNNNLRYIDWSENKDHPKTLKMEDIDSLRMSGKYFARKFNPADTDILDYLDQLRKLLL